MRRPVQLGQMLRPPHEKATRRSCPHASHRQRVKPSTEVTTGDVGAQLLLDVAGKAALVVLARVGEERFEVLPHELMEHGLQRLARQVRGRERGHGWSARQSATRAIEGPE